MTDAQSVFDIPDNWLGPETPIDFIVVGAGAAGCPLAARLAERGYCVLIIEMGPRSAPLATDVKADSISVPLLHPEATEDPRYALQYFVKQRDDSTEDPGTFYPRGQGVGGCANHNAMITLCGPNDDWDELAELTGDRSWGAEAMRHYFERVECCTYAQPLKWWEKLAARLTGRTGWEGCRHGTSGWLKTSLPDTKLLKADKAMLSVVLSTGLRALESGIDQASDWLKFAATGRIRSSMDPNHWDNIEQNRGGVIQIPCAIDARGQRSSPRDRLLDAQAKCSDRLHLLTGVLVTRVELEDKKAVGVRVLPQPQIYKAVPEPQPLDGNPDELFKVIRCRHEVILSAGAFNTPQLMMLSGIGDPEHLKQFEGLPENHSLPGVGRNLQDRYEVPIVTTMSKPFASLDGVMLTSDPKLSAGDEALKQYLRSIELSGKDPKSAGRLSPGIYASNGAMIGLLYRTKQEDKIADIFVMALAGQFTGYRTGWSKSNQLIPELGTLTEGKSVQHRTVSWLILKARTKNNAGYVKLKSSDPLERPEINFRSFAECDNELDRKADDAPTQAPGAQDLLAMEEGVEFVESLLNEGKNEGHITSINFPGRVDGQSVQAWIRQTAWGHHACGTCKLGREDDDLAVVDSRFKVRGIKNLRIVDASIFPRIPGYFIVTNIYMVAEKAADMVTEDNPRTTAQLDAAKLSGVDVPILPSTQAESYRQIFPTEFEAAEVALIDGRRHAAGINKDETSKPVPTEQAQVTEPTAEPVPPPGLSDNPLSDSSSSDNSKSDNPAFDGHWFLNLPLAEGISDNGTYPNDTLGLAISGGGIRSSTFALGFLQALASCKLLRRIDLLSTVSGGGYVGTFLGRYFDQLRNSLSPNANGHHAAHAIVAESLTDSRSVTIQWLRQHANYLASTGTKESLFNFATFWRNFLSLHFVLGMLFFAIFGLMNGVLYWDTLTQLIADSRTLVDSLCPVAAATTAHTQSLWWVFTEATIWYFVLPTALGYWLVSQDRQGQVIIPVLTIYGLLAFALTLVLRTALPLGVFMATIFTIVLVQRRVQDRIGSANPESSYRRLLYRHLLTENLATATVALCVLLILGLINAIGHYLSMALLVEELSWNELLPRIGLLIAPFLAAAPIVRGLAGLVANKSPNNSSWLSRLAKIPYLLTGLIVLIGTILPLSIVSFFSHAAYGNGGNVGGGLAATALAIVITFLLGTKSARPFVNRSGPLALYASRLSRVFLGATNPARHRGTYSSAVTSLVPGDDVDHDKYKPHVAGGPIHLFNIAVNETVDVVSQRGQRDRQGENMAVGPVGLNIARRWHARWGDASNGKVEVKPMANGTGMHPFLGRDGEGAKVEQLTIRMWMAISGAAISSGAGRLTSLAFSLLVTLGNFRLGYWWDSGLTTLQRANSPIRLTLNERLKSWTMQLFTTQSLLVAELRGRFGGPWRQYFYISDGGHFENSGAYELLRRRIPLIIVIDGGQDVKGQTVGLGELARISRIDFGCELNPVSPTELATLNLTSQVVQALGQPADLLHGANGRAQHHASLMKVTYPAWKGAGPDPWNNRTESWMLYVRLTVTGDEPMDVVSYQAQNPDFPNQTTLDQDFDEPQFESYRRLGQHIAQQLFS